MELAVENNCKCIAFPAISTGVYGYPVKEASRIALNAVGDFLREHNVSIEVIFVSFSENNHYILEQLQSELCL